MPKRIAITDDKPVGGGDRGGATARKGKAKTERRPWPADGARAKRSKRGR